MPSAIGLASEWTSAGDTGNTAKTQQSTGLGIPRRSHHYIACASSVCRLRGSLVGAERKWGVFMV